MIDKQKMKNTALGGLVQNPVFVLVLGMCPVIGTSTLESGVILGVATMAVLVLSNLLISLLRKLIPDKVRIPCYIVVIATLVTLVDLFLGHFMSPDSYDQIATYVSLIVVNCIVLGRAEAYASKNGPLYAAVDGFSMGVGFTVVLAIYGGLRELLSNGSLWGASVFGSGYVGIKMFGSTPGGFILLGLLMALFNVLYDLYKKHAAMKKEKPEQLADLLAQNAVASENPDEEQQSPADDGVIAQADAPVSETTANETAVEQSPQKPATVASEKAKSASQTPVKKRRVQTETKEGI